MEHPVRFALFVDGSNLFGIMKELQIRVDDYGKLYRFVFQRAYDAWKDTLQGQPPSAQLRRVYWYVVGQMDDWNLTDPKAQLNLKERFESDREVKRAYMAIAGERLKGKPQASVPDEAWAICFREFEDWYKRKREILAGMQRFHHAVQANEDFIDIRQCGRWKVDFLHRSLEEKRNRHFACR
jgi:hypothetical protein